MPGRDSGLRVVATTRRCATTNEGVMYRVGDQWDKRHDVLGHMMRCTCVGNGRGEWSCVAYSQLKDQCIVDSLNLRDQCQEPETKAFYQIGESWDKVIHGVMYKCYCNGHGIGELSCEPQQSYPGHAERVPVSVDAGGQRPVQVIITESGNQPDSHPIQWNAPSSAHITQYILKWRQPGITYEGQLISVLRFGRREVDTSESVTEITSSSFVISWVSASDTVSGFRVEYELSEEGQMMGEPSVLAPDAPVDHEVEEVQETSIVITWDKPLAPITGYRVVYTPSVEGEGESTELTLPNTATAVTLSDLRPGKQYNISIYAVEDTLESVPVFVQVNTSGDPLPEEVVATPTELQFVEVSDSQIVLTWSGPLGAISEYRITVADVEEPGTPQREMTVPPIQSAYVANTHTHFPGYRVVYTPSVEGEGESTELTLPNTATAVTLSDLRPGKQYNISIYAVEDTLESVPVFVQVNTSGDPLPEEVVATPTELQFVEVSDSQIVLTWSGPLGAISEYRITVADVEEPGTPQREMTVPPIQSAYVPDAPSNVGFLNVTDVSAIVVWSPPRARIQGYRLVLSGEGSTPRLLRLPSRLTQYTLLNLRPDSGYTVTLHAEQDSVLSEGHNVYFSTGGTEVTSTSIIISWSPAPHVGYKLTVRPSQGGEAPRDVTSDSGSIFITGLTPGVEYTYDIQPVLDGHEHGSTVTQRVVNPETGGVIVEWGGTDTPEVPQLTGLSDENVTDTAVGIRWSPFNSTVVTGDRITVTAAGESVPTTITQQTEIDVGKGLLLCNRLSELLNPNYEDLSPGWGATALPATPEDSDTSPGAADEPERLTRVFEEPEYLNVPQSSLPRCAHNSRDNPDYRADFLLPATSTANSSGLFLPAVENLEYVGLNTAVQPFAR
ncbi:hypothetical protein CRUP_009333 [Coryphaenoides rupestris]|nr:hypothetical protein CRUP_009333 [Coryphaenoides rupestris]